MLNCQGRPQTSRRGPVGELDQLDPGKETVFVADPVEVAKGGVRDHVHDRIQLHWGFASLERLRDLLRSLKEVAVVAEVHRRNCCLNVLAASV